MDDMLGSFQMAANDDKPDDKPDDEPQARRFRPDDNGRRAGNCMGFSDRQICRICAEPCRCGRTDSPRGDANIRDSSL